MKEKGKILCFLIKKCESFIEKYEEDEDEEDENSQATWSCRFSDVCEEVHCSRSDKYIGSECLLENDAARRRGNQEKE